MSDDSFYKKPAVKKKTVKKKAAKKPKKEGCEACGLHENCTTPKFPVYGKGKKKILMVKEHPSQREDEKSSPYAGATGGMLKRKMRSLDINHEEDCWTTYAVKCNSKKFGNKELNLCRPNLQKFIEENKPEKIIVFGEHALKSVLDDRMEGTGVTKWTNRAIPDQALGAWVFPLHSTKDVLMRDGDIPFTEQFNRGFTNALTHKKPFPNNVVEDKQLFLITSVSAAIIYLESLRHERIVTFDYETTGLKPHAPGHEILCVSFAMDGDKAVCFPMFKDKEFLRALRRILQNPKIKKIAHNLKMENSWTRTILGYSVKGWYWDTMIGSHVIDNRGNCNSLKDQTFFRQGIQGYEHSMKPFITSKDKSNNSFNKMKEAPLMDVLRYCALDSIFTFRLYQAQKQEMKDRLNGFLFFMEGAVAFAETHDIGMHCNAPYFEKQYAHVQRKQDRLDKKIMSSEDVQAWDGGKAKKPVEFNYDSNTQLGHLVYDILGYTPLKKTKGGANSTDMESLSQLDAPFIKHVAQWKKLDKVKGTYLSGFLREQVDGVIRTNFNLHTTKTMRSSSNSPNFQNIPKRDEQMQRLIRTGLIPRPGRQLLEVDYSGVEVTISACYHHDPAMIAYLKDESTDMHLDSAKELFLNPELHKKSGERYLAKNNFVFPQFYGDYYKSCATGLWQTMTPEAKEILADQKITNYMKFEKHVKSVESILWNKRFTGYRDWKIATWNEYLKKGFLKSKTGFVYDGVMKKNDALNYCIQGSAFHCLLKSYINVNKFLKQEKMDTLLIGQIHDALVLDVVPEELEFLLPNLRRIMCDDLQEEWDWISVPLDIEADISEVDGNWACMTGIKA